MKKIFLDTNILIDFYQSREPFFMDAATIIQMGADKLVDLRCSSTTIINMFYILRGYPKSELYSKIRELLSIVTVIGNSSESIERALKWEWKDFEDCVQYITAQASESDIIITRNSQDFEGITIPVMEPKEFIETLYNL